MTDTPTPPQATNKNSSPTHPDRETWALILLFLVICGVGYFGYTKFQNKQKALLAAQQKVASTTAELAQARRKLTETRQEMSELKKELKKARDENDDLEDDLEDEKERNDKLENQVETVTETVGDLKNTVSTEPEILKKYSRVFFLSENYKPANLEQISDEYLAPDDDSLTVDERVAGYLEDLLEAANDDGVELHVTSAYRPFSAQHRLNDRYVRTFGEGANTFSAEQGYSEHQLGTAVDFATPENNYTLEGFAQTASYEWLKQNAHEYGFILSYPKGNEFYQFEPWHWRFVGEALAEDLDESGQYFYDLSQREIDEYRDEVFN
jgi:D-alanyl-D-alanine carboxypeptidase